MPKLKDDHIIPERIRKMKVCCASQTFSYTVASVMALFIRSGTTSVDGRLLSERAMGTVYFIKFMDDLFDRVNATNHIPNSGKPLHCSLRSATNHFQFWECAKKIFSSMYFVDSRGTNTKPPSVKIGW